MILQMHLLSSLSILLYLSSCDCKVGFAKNRVLSAYTPDEILSKKKKKKKFKQGILWLIGRNKVHPKAGF